MSPRFTTSGGSRRSTLSPAFVARMPFSRRPFSTGAASPRNSTPTMSPSPRTSAILSLCARAELLEPAHQVERRARATSRGSRAPSSWSSTASAAAAHTGLPPKVLPWSPTLSAGAQLLLEQERAHGQAAAERLGQGQDVGHDARVLVGEHLPGAPEAALDLVEDQERAALAADRLEALQELGRRRADAALALHRLEHHGRGLVADRPRPPRRDRPRARSARPGTSGSKGSRYFGRPGGRERAHGAAVEGALERDVLGAALLLADAPRELHGPFPGLGARVAEEDLRGEGEGAPGARRGRSRARCGTGCSCGSAARPAS